MRLRRISALVACATFLLPGAAFADEVVMDGITPQTNSTVYNYYGMTTAQNYGFGFIAGDSREISKIDLIVSTQIASGNVVGYLYRNSNNGASRSGTLVATFNQPNTASAYSGGITNAFLVRLVGSAQLQSGQKYWIYFNAPSLEGNAVNAWVTTTPTVSASWSIVTSGSNYVMTNNSGAFNWAAYPAFRLIASTPTTIDVTLAAGGSTATYRSTTTIRAAVNSNGPVTFYANRKYIPGCKGVQSSAGVATCQWKPSLHGVIRLTARVVPTDSANYLPKLSNDFEIRTVTRTNRR